MSTLTFNTFKYVETLKSAGVPEEYARAEMEALAAALDETLVVRDLATKQDIKALETASKHEIDALRLAMEAMKVELIKWMAGLLLAQGAVIAALVKLL